MPCTFNFHNIDGSWGECNPFEEDHEGAYCASFRLWANECCGLVTVSNFYGRPRHRKEGWEFINEKLKISFPGCWSQTDENSAKFTLMAIVNDEQLSNGWGEEFDKWGWKLTCSFFNPNTHNMCYQYMRIIERKEEE